MFNLHRPFAGQSRRLPLAGIVALFLAAAVLFVPVSVSAKTLVTHRPMTSFAHFLYGTSGVFPPAAAFNRDLLAWKSPIDEPTMQALNRIALWFRSSIAKFETEHQFETAFYQASTEAADLDGLYQTWRNRGIPTAPELHRDFHHLYQLFSRLFAADQSLIQQELARLNALPEMRHFGIILRQIDHFFRPEPNQQYHPLPFEIVAVPLRLTPTEMQELRQKGNNSIFGRNFGRVQIIELVLIPEIPDLSKRMLSHLLGVALHELCHHFYTERHIGSYVQTHLNTQTQASHYLTALYLNEGLATALGNGLFSVAIGSQDPQWYARDSINRFGHALMPPAQRHITRNLSLDRSFCLAAHQAFLRLFPAYQRQWEFVFSRMHLHGLDADKSLFLNHLKRHLPSYLVVDNQDSCRPLTRVHVIRSQDRVIPATLSDALRTSIELRTRLSDNFIFSHYDQASDTSDIVFCVSDPSNIALLLERAFKLRYRTAFLTLPRRP